jgi:23S rRNA (guanosine2251-2'-O)-methyltransferase
MKKRFHKSGQPQQRTSREGEQRNEAPKRFESKPRFDKDQKRDGFKKDNFKKDGFTRNGIKRDAALAIPRLVGPLLWGFHAVRAAMLNPDRKILRLLVTEAGLDTFHDTIAQAKALGLKRPAPEVMDKAIYDRMMPPSSVHQGVGALVEALEPRDAHDLVAGLAAGEKSTILILDQVTDPHNVGAILRSASAFGCTGVIMQDRHAPELSGVLAKAASGAVDAIPVALETNLSRAVELLQEHGFFVAGLDERGTAIADLPAQNRVALVLGAEGAGIRRLVADHCDALVSLPTQGPILSLNVSNAAAVALYALKVAD